MPLLVNRDCGRKVWRTEGITAFAGGLGPTLIWSDTPHTINRLTSATQFSVCKWGYLSWL
ncbi:hypothetical protein V8E55_008066 [Tylopilus felleus]